MFTLYTSYWLVLMSREVPIKSDALTKVYKFDLEDIFFFTIFICVTVRPFFIK